MDIDTTRIRITTLASALAVATAAGFAQADPAYPPLDRALGGTARFSVRGELVNPSTGRRSHRQFLLFSPYFLSPPDERGRQRVTQLNVGVDNASDTDGLPPEATRRRTSVTVSVTRGRRVSLFAFGRLSGGLEYGIGPSLGLQRFGQETTFSADRPQLEYDLGAVGYADVVLGYRLSERVRVVADVLNATANARLSFAENEGLSAYDLSAGALNGIAFGVEWGLIARAGG